MSISSNSILVLYTRLPGYTLACLKTFRDLTGYEVHVVKYPADTMAPFELDVPKGFTIYKRNDFNKRGLLQLMKKISPAAVLTAGWSDQGYKQLARTAKKEGIPSICGLDNQWIGNFRQQLATIASGIVLKPFFDFLWVPGYYQYEYARRLGYPRDKILTGLYSADTETFLNTTKGSHFTKRFLYVGRMISIKGIQDIVEVARRFEKEGISDWKFQLIGNGPQSDDIPQLPNIHYQSFLQPEELRDEMEGKGVFLLASHKEPWGVVVHEMASAGFPLLTSDVVGANAGFLREGWNGFTFESGNSDQLYHAAKRFCDLGDETLVQMGNRSRQLSRSVTPEIWAATLTEIINP